VKLHTPHRWNVDCREAAVIQERLRERVIRRGSPRDVRLVAGADVSYNRGDDRFTAGVVVLGVPELDVVEEVSATGVVRFPYVPGFLTFREGPVLSKAFAKLKTRPDLVLFDGQGIAHPRGLGLAAHMGLLLDVPAIGCAKSRLCGRHVAPGREAGARTPLRLDGKTIGSVVRTRTDVKPVFVSIGHRIALRSAVAWVLKTCRGVRLPEPTRRAHKLVNRVRVLARDDRDCPGVWDCPRSMDFRVGDSPQKRPSSRGPRGPREGQSLISPATDDKGGDTWT